MNTGTSTMFVDRDSAVVPGPKPMLDAMLHSHCSWLLNREMTNKERFAPDLLADRGIRVVDQLVVPLLGLSLLAPAGAGERASVWDF